MNENYNKGYLTEDLLGDFLIKNLKNIKILKEFPKKKRDENLCEKYEIKNFRKKYDYAFEYNNKLYLIEFDGFFHYTNPYNIVKDKKFRTFNRKDIIVIEIPYFLQLNKETIKYLFKGKELSLKFNNFFINSIDLSKFPSGFWSDRAIKEQTPVFFCKLGIKRYENIYKKLPKKIKEEIEKSLKRGEKELGIEPELLY